MPEQRAVRSVLLKHHVGLHARPSVKLTKLAKTFASRIELSVADDDSWIDAKSIVKVMAAKAPRDTMIHLRAEGEDAEQSLEAIAGLIERDFDEGHSDASGVEHAGAA